MTIKRPVSNQPMPSHAQCVFKGIMFDVYQWEQKLFDGSTATFEKLKRPDTVIILPVLPDGSIVLNEQEQPGQEPFIAAPGGRVDHDEDIVTAAKRELLEESGYSADTLTLWCAHQPTTKIDWAVFVFIAKNITKTAELALDAGEKIQLKTVSFDELIDIGMDSGFAGEEAAKRFTEAKYLPEKRVELEKLFDPHTF